MTGKRDLTRRVETLEEQESEIDVDIVGDLEISNETLAELREQDARALSNPSNPSPEMADLSPEERIEKGNELLRELRERDVAALEDSSDDHESGGGS